MKKIIPLSIIGLVVASMFSSCTLTKRHYNNGYHVNWHHKVRTQPAAEKNETVVANEEKTAVVTTEKVQQLKNDVSSSSVAPIANTNVQPVASEKTVQPTATRNHTPLLQKPTTGNKTSVKPTAKKIRAALRDIKKINHSDDPLSLFWIIILIIFLFWAVGFLTGGYGIGGLINLLLVIVLILLVLWLLRVL